MSVRLQGISRKKPHGQNNTDRGYPLPSRAEKALLWLLNKARERSS